MVGWHHQLNGPEFEHNLDHSIIVDIAPKYCILDTLVDYKGYSNSPLGFLLTIVDIMAI